MKTNNRKLTSPQSMNSYPSPMLRTSIKSICDIMRRSGRAGALHMDNKDNTVIFYITNNGLNLAKKLKRIYPDAQALKFKPQGISRLWGKSKNLIFIMATGIVVRTIAPLIKDKMTDPAVVVLDEKGEYTISLLGGHLGGANKIAKEIADFLGGRAVITTASDVNNLPAIDLWAKENNLVIENLELLPQIGARLINNGALRIYIQNTEIKLPDEFLEVSDPADADILITNRQFKSQISNLKSQIYIRPKNLVVGIGCNSGTSAEEIEDSVKNTFEKNNLSFLSIHSIATSDKKGNEPGLKAFAKKHGFEVKTFTPAELNTVSRISKSDAVFKATGAIAVAEPAAILSSGNGKLFVPKQKIGNVTVAVAEKRATEQQNSRAAENDYTTNTALLLYCSTGQNKGKIFIVGTGPGSIEHITPYAQDVIRKSDVIVGYSTYLDLIKEIIKDKEVISTGMTEEVDRCQMAVELAISGKTVSLISGGDPGIYAMAGLVFEMLKNRNESCVMSDELNGKNSLHITHYASRITIEVIPGIPALNACAARLGAPLMHDFASISLSDRLTPWEVIEKRLEAAAMADFVIVLYNPKSLGRPEHINKARNIILKYRSPEIPVGIVKAAMREGEKVIITDLKNMLNHDVDMQTTVIIGNSKTFIWDGWMVTPRGYAI